MALTESNMLPLGTKAPDFTLLDTITGQMKSLSELESDTATVVMFICNHCPFVIHMRDKLVEITNAYLKKGVSFIAISSNDAITHPADAPDKMTALAKEHKFAFPYLYDESQAVAKAYDAACTPDFYIFDHTMTLTFRGRFDDSTPGNNQPITGADLCTALDAVINKQPISNTQLPSMGCNIKWREN